MAEIYQLPSENSGNAGMGNIPFSIPIGGFGNKCWENLVFSYFKRISFVRWTTIKER